jgi:hypothetical protein
MLEFLRHRPDNHVVMSILFQCPIVGRFTCGKKRHSLTVTKLRKTKDTARPLIGPLDPSAYNKGSAVPDANPLMRFSSRYWRWYEEMVMVMVDINELCDSSLFSRLP